MPNKYLEIIQPAIDQYGFIAQLSSDNRDAGDSSQREAMLALLSYAGFKQDKISQTEFDEIKSRYLANYDRLREGCMPGEIKRHVGEVPQKWYSKKWKMSRDQWTPNVIALGLMGNWRQKADMILGMAMRGFLFTTNIYANGENPGSPKLPDITVFSAWGFVFRWCPIF